MLDRGIEFEMGISEGATSASAFPCARWRAALVYICPSLLRVAYTTTGATPNGSPWIGCASSTVIVQSEIACYNASSMSAMSIAIGLLLVGLLVG